MRKRFIRSTIILVLFFCTLFSQSERLIVFIKESIKVDKEISLIFLSPGEALWSNIIATAFISVVLAFPFIAFEIWQFVAPGLKRNEKRFATLFILLASFFFYMGLSFALFIVLPFSVGFLMQYKTEGLMPMISIGKLLGFYAKFALSFAAVFELPLILAMLGKMGLVTVEFLAKNRKFAVLIAFIISAILTPTTDVINQLIMAVPIIILYEVGIILVRITR